MSSSPSDGRQASGPLALSNDSEWKTSYEISTHRLAMLVRDLRQIRDWALVSFRPTGVVGRAIGRSNVALGISEIPAGEIESSGSACTVAMRVSAFQDEDVTGFLQSDDDVTLELDAGGQTLTVGNGYLTTSVDLLPASDFTWPGLPMCEFGTVARMKGWELSGAIQGSCAATEAGFEVESDLNDIRVSSRDTPWEKTIEDVVVETSFDTAQFSSLFFPSEICDPIHTDDDVELRFGDNRPMIVQIEDRTTYAVAPQIPPEESGPGGESV